MKESQESKIEFPDRNPNDWHLVVKFLDPTITESEKDEHFISLLRDLPREACQCVSWLDYLGMETLVKKYDKKAATFLQIFFQENKIDPGYSAFSWWKTVPFPLTHNMLKQSVKQKITSSLVWLTRSKFRAEKARKRFQGSIKDYLLDDQVGDELWQHLLSMVDLPDHMLQTYDRKTLVTSSWFVYVLEVCSRNMKHPDPPEYTDKND
jgi:hypothetical protein